MLDDLRHRHGPPQCCARHGAPEPYGQGDLPINAPFNLDPLLKRAQVEQLVGLKKSAIYNHIRDGSFPAPVHLRGKRTARWRASAIRAWIEDQPTG